MPLDFGGVLHVLAHELRTPVGIAHGYLRLLLEDRLTATGDQRRALEQMQKALARVSALSHEASELATWYEREAGEVHAVSAQTLVERVAAASYEQTVIVDSEPLAPHAMLRTSHLDALTQAITTVVAATARELHGVPCIVRASLPDGASLQLLAGAGEQLDRLAAAAGSDTAHPIALERGGLGLALIQAALVLDAHGAERWSVGGSRQIAGIRIPLDERLHS